MGTVHIPTLLEGILEATAAEAAAKARITTLRASLEAEARRRLAVEGAAPTWKAAKLGSVRLDEATDWTATVDDEAAFGSYVAEVHPTEATVAIHVNASDAEDALQALTFIGVNPVETPRIEVRSAWLAPFLKGLAVDVEEERDASAQVTRTVVAADATTGTIVPGIGVTRSEAKLVVSLDRDRRTAAIAEARTTATALVEAASAEDDTPDVDAVALDARRRELEAMHGDQLAVIAKATGLGSSGTKAALAERIARTELATGNVIRPASGLASVEQLVDTMADNHAARAPYLGAADQSTTSPLPEGTEVEEVSTVPLDQPVEEVPDGGTVLDVEELAELTALVDEVDTAPEVVDNRRRNLDGLSREVLRQYAKAAGINPGGSKGDLLDRLVEAGTTVLDVNDHARKARAS